MASYLIYAVWKASLSDHIYINFACLGFDCLFVSNERKNRWTDKARHYWGSLRYPTFFIFVEFWKCAKNIIKSANLFCYLHMYNTACLSVCLLFVPMNVKTTDPLGPKFSLKQKNPRHFFKIRKHILFLFFDV